MVRLIFLSSNDHKIAEAQAILGSVGIEIVPIKRKIEEIQTTSIDSLVRDKCVKAFRDIGRPLFVEHTGLEVDRLNGFPGGLTQVFWDTLQADRFCELFGQKEAAIVKATTVIGFCDGRKIHKFAGTVVGRAATEPRGPRDFQWDCVFVPDGERETFAEMGMERKNTMSMRRIALEKLRDFLA